jgi:RHS repeat-associated protein
MIVLMEKTGTFDQPFRFSTKRYDEDTGLSYYGYRFYSASLGRWITRDPLGEAGGINLYGFVGNNAISGIDPHGLIWSYIYRGGKYVVQKGAEYLTNPKNVEKVGKKVGKKISKEEQKSGSIEDREGDYDNDGTKNFKDKDSEYYSNQYFCGEDECYEDVEPAVCHNE